MKALFITSTLEGRGGGGIIAKRNILLLQQILGKENVEIFNINRRKESLYTIYERCFFAYVVGVNKTVIKNIVDRMQQFNLIWIDGSFYGSIAKEIKRAGYQGKIVTFFHNIERYFCKRKWFEKLLYPFYNGPIVRSEINAIFYSTNVITLTERDASYVKHYNKKAHITILPSSLNDKFEDINGYSNATSLLKNKEIQLLFVGSYFYANISGISWFIDNVLPHVYAKLTIVGANMDKLPYKKTNKLEINGYVDDLGVYYRESDIVIAPIFEGSGMKTKTTEALMWGKYIIGTNESFCGFEINDMIGLKCNTAEEFIIGINKLIENGYRKYNKYSRELYLKKYSLNSSLNILQKLISI